MKTQLSMVAVSSLFVTMAAGCGGEVPTSPSQTAVLNPPGARPPLPFAGLAVAGVRDVGEGTIVALTGTVVSAHGSPLSGATVTILDGVNGGRSAMTNSSGAYRFDNVQASNGNISAKATGYQEDIRGIFIDGAAPLDFSLQGPNFTGAWRGLVFSTTCSDDGVLEGICDELPALGASFALALTQSGTAVTGSIQLANVPPANASGASQNDRLVLTGRGDLVSGANGIQMSFEDWSTRLSGSNMVGSFSWRLFPTASGVRGGAKWNFELEDVTLAPTAPRTATAVEGSETGLQVVVDWASAALRR